MKPLLLTISTVILSTSFLCSQKEKDVFVPDNLPGKGPVNLVPLGGKGPSGAAQNMRTQIRIPASFLPAAGSTISDIGFAAAGKGNYLYKSLSISFAHLKGSKLSPVFADNLSDNKMVLDKKNFKYDFPSAGAFHLLGLENSFEHDGRRDLMVDITIQGAFFNGNDPGSRRSNSLETVYAINYLLSKPQKQGFGPFKTGAKIKLVVKGLDVVSFGQGCAGSNTKVPTITFSPAPKLGKSSSFATSGGARAAAALLLFGTSHKSWGKIPLPLFLDALGAKGCAILTEVLLMLSGTLGTGGVLSLPFTVPNEQSLLGLPIVGQWAILDPKANALGFSFSRGIRSSIQK